MSNHRRGIVYNSHNPQPATPTVGRQVGRIAKSVAQPPPEEAPRITPRIITPSEEREEIAQARAVPAIRRGLVTATGMPIRGLQPETVAQRQASAEAETEKCKRCDRMMRPSEMRTIIANAEVSSNPLRLCMRQFSDGRPSCAAQTYKDPKQTQDAWRPQIPRVRFQHDGELAGRPIGLKGNHGLGLGDLVNRDSYFTESEAMNLGVDVNLGVRRK